MLRVIGGVAEFNLILVVVGYFLLTSLLQGRSPLTWLTFAGIALLVGASAVGLILGIAAVAGSSTGPVPLAITSAALSLGGLLMARFAPERWRRRSFVPQPASESRSPLSLQF